MQALSGFTRSPRPGWVPLLFLVGCAVGPGEDPGVGVNPPANAWSEHGLIAEEPLSIRHGNVGILHLETGETVHHPGFDTAETSIDVVTYTIREAGTYQLCIGDSGDPHEVELSDEGSVLLAVVAVVGTSTCETVDLKAKSYALTVSNKGTGADATTVFVRTPTDDAFRIDVLSNQCDKCNLAGAVLRGADLRNANLEGSVLSDGVLVGANLAGAELGKVVRTDWTGAVWE